MNILCLVISALIFAPELTLKQIMADPIWIGEIPETVRISGDRQSVYFQVPQAMPKPKKWMKLDLRSGEVTTCEPSDFPGALTETSLVVGKHRVLTVAGDLWIATADGKPAPLLSRQAKLSLVRALDDNSFIYLEGDNLHRFEISGGRSIQLTDLVFADEPKEEDTFYASEEKKLIKFVADIYESEAQNKTDQKLQRDLGALRKPEKTYLGEGLVLGSTFIPRDTRFMADLSSDQKYVAVTLSAAKEGKPTEFAQFIDKDPAVRARAARPKVGHETPTWKLTIFDRQSGELKWLDLAPLPEIATDRLAAIKENASEEDKRFLPKVTEGPRPVMLIPGGFQPEGGNNFLVTALSRDYKDRWIFLVDPATMAITLIDHQFDEAWITYVNQSLDNDVYVSGAAFWRNNGREIAWLSDREGYQNLYVHRLADRKTFARIGGNFEVHHPFEDPQGKYWYFHSSREHPGEIHFYRMPIDGGAWQQLTREPGQHMVTLSADGAVMVDLFSQTDLPPQLRACEDFKTWRLGFDGRSEAFKALQWMRPEVTSYKNRDGKDVYARVYRPAANANGAGVIFVHGAGYLQNAHKGWSGYFREYMFHNLLAHEGFTILDPDYQASAGYGRDWRTAIYRHMGGKDLDDILDGAKFLVAETGVAAEKLGLYGGSYGGFISLMAMFTAPDVFQAAAALRPVTDWAYYNDWYTSRILNTPFDDPEAYRRSSPIYFAEGLKGHLLICHGMVDDNVQYQDSVRLAQRLIELHKHNWELSSYPVEPHGFKTPSSWYDEYRRIHELFQRTLLDQ